MSAVASCAMCAVERPVAYRDPVDEWAYCAGCCDVCSSCGELVATCDAHYHGLHAYCPGHCPPCAGEPSTGMAAPISGVDELGFWLLGVLVLVLVLAPSIVRGVS
jgi:hypothetical protein